MESLWAERLVSLKAGSLAAIAFAAVWSLAQLARAWFLPVALSLLSWRGLGALISGFLFGVTYRYLATSDNPFLKDGAVLAFGVVRGLGPLEVVDNLGDRLLPLVWLGGESLIGFALSRWVLDRALHRQWLR